MASRRWLDWLCRRIRRDRDAETAREIQNHLDLETEDLRAAGLGCEDAGSVARRSFGNATLIREEIHAVWISTVLERLMQDVRFAGRSLAKNPGFSLVALLTLAFGIGANTAIFTFVSAAFLKPLPYPNADRIVVLRQYPLRPLQGVPASTPVHPRSFVHWQERAQSFEALALAQAIPMTTDGPDGAEQVPGLWVSADLFRAFGVRPLLGQDFPSHLGMGRNEVRSGKVGAIILSHGYWQRRFGGDPAIVGKTIAAGRNSAVVVGVMPAGFRAGTLNVDVYTPMRIDRSRPEAVGSRSFLCIGRLRTRVTIESARAEMEAIAAQVSKEELAEKDFGVHVLSLRDYLVGDSRSILFVLSGVVGLVLLIACGNLAGLLLTKGIGRQSELGVRAALGASRWRIVQQLAVESFILSAAGGALGLCVGWTGSRALVALSESAVEFGQMADVGLDVRVLAFTVALVFFTTVLCGFIPAWYASKVDLQSSIKLQGRGSAGRGHVRARSVLVVTEVALTVVLLLSGGLLLRSFAKLSQVRLGFQPENVLTMRTLILGEPEFRSNLANTILERVEALPGVRSAGTIQFLPLSGMTNNGPFHFVGRPLPADPMSMESDVSTVSRGYFAAIGMDLLRGREFDRQDRIDGPRVALVNQAFVNKYSRDEDPIGRVIVGDWANPRPTEIIGVVNDIRHNGLTAEPRPTVFLAQAQVPGYFTNLVVRTNIDPAAMAATIRREVRRVDPKQPFTDIQPMEHYVAKQLARPRLYSHFVGTFAILALFLAAVGLYGLLAYEVGQRRHEIGLRMALGARPTDVVSSTICQGLRLVMAGVVLGTVLALGLSSVLSKLLFDVRVSDPLTCVAVAVVLGLVTVAATLVPARRAALVDPLVALRYE